jgi:hypothetical protein
MTARATPRPERDKRCKALLNVCTRQGAAGEIRRTQPSTTRLRPGEVDAAKVGHRCQIEAAQVRTGHVGLRQVGAGQVRVAQIAAWAGAGG